MKERVLVLGGTGYVGQSLQHYLGIQNIPFINLSRVLVDYTKHGVLHDYLKRNSYSFLINCAGFTGKPTVDACEDYKTETLWANAVLPGIIREACESAKLPWGHVSSGCIYQGRNMDGDPFQEDAVPNFSFRTNNCSFYSGTKALGEEILEGAKDCYIWRLRIPFNHIDSKRNYLSKLMHYTKLLQVENSVSHVDEYVRAIWQSWHKRIPFGKYNITNPGVITAREIVELFRKYKLGKDHYEFIDSEYFHHHISRVPRSSCVLDSSKILKTGIELTEVHEAIDKALQNWQPAS